VNFNVSNCSNYLMFKCQRDSDPDFETIPRVRVLVQMRGRAPRRWRPGGWLEIFRYSGWDLILVFGTGGCFRFWFQLI